MRFHDPIAAPARVHATARPGVFALCLLILATLGLSRPASAATILERAMDAVLVVHSNDADDSFLGSAFLWGEEALVAVTNAHVVGTAEEVRLKDRHGREEIGRVIARDPVRDVAVIALEPSAQPRRGLVPVEGNPDLGMVVHALGAPLGLEFTLTTGLISATGRQVETAVPLLFLQHDAAVNPGSSGGPLVDASGRLLGMNSQIADGSRMFVGIAYAIAAADLSRIVEGLIEETLVPFPVLGMNARPVDRKLAEMLAVDPQGLLVDGVKKGGLAERAGIRAGDVILAVDDQPLAAPGAFAFALEAAIESEAADLTLRRAGEEIRVTLALVLPEEEAASGLRTRSLRDLRAEPERTTSYRLGALGVVLGPDGTVAALTENSPGLIAGLARGDRIIAVNGVAVGADGLAALEITGAALLLVEAPGGNTRHVTIDPWARVTGLRPVGGANVLDPAVVVF